MLQKVEDFIAKHFDEVMNLKNVYLVIITFTCIILYIALGYTVKRYNIAVEYIHDLESVIETQDIDVSDICGTDAYVEWHDK